MSLYDQTKRELAARLTPNIAQGPAPSVKPEPAPVAEEPVFSPRTFLTGFLDTVPTEVLFAYVVTLALVSPSRREFQWALFAIFLLATPSTLFLTVNTVLQNRGGRLHVPWGAMIIATAGFAAWAALLPDSVFLSVPGYSPIFGLLVVSALVLVAPILNRAVRPTSALD
jgi:hypothetical protein